MIKNKIYFQNIYYFKINFEKIYDPSLFNFQIMLKMNKNFKFKEGNIWIR
jgi:hypothetical protein